MNTQQNVCLGGAYSTNKRKKWIDRCRGLAILIVLLGHTNPPFRKLVYGFHMPLFLFYRDIYFM